MHQNNKVKTNIGPLTYETEILTQDNKYMAEILNNNFASVFTTEDNVPECRAPARRIMPLEIEAISTENMTKYLDQLDKNKSMGPDSLSPRLLKELKQQILQPLIGIFNQ